MGIIRTLVEVGIHEVSENYLFTAKEYDYHFPECPNHFPDNKVDFENISPKFLSFSPQGKGIFKI